MELYDESKFSTKKELLDFLVENKGTIIAQKKAALKHADCVIFSPSIVKPKEQALKANDPIDIENLNEIKVVAIINTTNLMDSHLDVHIPNLWTKSLKENKAIMHLQEHKMAFDKIISDGDNLKAYAKTYSWGELGFDFEGDTQALVFESKIERKRNEFMFKQYASGYVKNHSVGMRYVKLIFCVNDEDYGAEFEAWEKYFPMVANQDRAEEKGFFWAVKEAKVIEGSAVPLGSNWVTPTLENNKAKPPQGTSKIIQPSEDTEKRNYLLGTLKN
ncbi:hypothetical protein KAR91_13060 [Candidatus Pacearchaeota archaeon]|nr:hypothetical protein [Candidatus Pacearchaeota archaeon]